MTGDRMAAAVRWLKEGRFEEALECFEGGEDVRSLFGCAVSLQMLGRFDQAETVYDRVLELDPEHQEALANLIAIHVERFDLDRVYHCSKRLLELNGDSAVALQGLIVVAVERREYEIAAVHFARLGPPQAGELNAIEYRLSREMVERLRSTYGSVAHSH